MSMVLLQLRFYPSISRHDFSHIYVVCALFLDLMPF